MTVHFSFPDSRIFFDPSEAVSFQLLHGSHVELSWCFEPSSTSAVITEYNAFKSFIRDFLSDIPEVYGAWALYIPWPVSATLFDDDGCSYQTFFLDPFNLPEAM